MDRSARLAAAQQWLQTYTGKDLVRGYHKYSGVDRPRGGDARCQASMLSLGNNAGRPPDQILDLLEAEGLEQVAERPLLQELPLVAVGPGDDDHRQARAQFVCAEQ